VFGDAGDAYVKLDGHSERWPLSSWLKLPGRHNLANALAATCAAVRLGADADAVRQGLQNYTPLPHRLQWVGEFAGRTFYNDSLATTPESAEVALDAFSSPIVLLAGGYDKGVDLSHMAAAIAGRVKAVALMGQTAPQLLLSPGCASYDWFRNFADRGAQFVEFVKSLSEERTEGVP
jgi:UDP-N-acetylmuramoylalanine--D-glutamate ligase